MALVINTSPAAYYSAHGDLIFVVYESVKANDPITYQDYKYVADIYVGATQVARLKSVPRPDNKRGVFNIGDVVRSYLATLLNPDPLVLQAQEFGNGEFSIGVTVKFGEEYNFTLFTNVTVDSERFYFNSYNGRLIGIETNLVFYQNKVASSRPVATTISSANVNNYLPYLPNVPTGISVEVKSYDQNGTNVDTINETVTPAGANLLQLINIGVATLNTIEPGFINNNTRYFTVNIGGLSAFQFNVGQCEPRYQIYTLHFLNKYGGFETWEFTKVSRKSIAINKTNFGRLPYTIDSSGGVVYYNANKVYNETTATYSSQYTEKMTLNTDILSDDEYTWLAELMVSPLVYIELFGYFIPITITNNNYTFNKWVNDKITNLTIDIEFGDTFNAQYR